MAQVEKIPIGKGDVIKQQFEIFHLLGRGGFGAVFEIYDSKRNEVFALKLLQVELKTPTEDDPGLAVEISVLRKLQHNHHFVRYIDSGKHGQYTFLVMQLVGKNLGDLRKSCPQYRFTLSTTLRLALQCIEAIEAMHAIGLLHRDIKPSNYTMGINETDRRNVYLLDFGLVRRFKSNGKIREPRPAAGFRGTAKYASLNCHKRLELGPHDDLWSLCYTLIEFIKGELPWSSVTDRKKVGEMKANMTTELLANVNAEIQTIYESVTKLKYSDEPPYHSYRELLSNLVQKNRITNNDPFDWEEGGVAYLRSMTPTGGISEAMMKKESVLNQNQKQTPTMMNKESVINQIQKQAPTMMKKESVINPIQKQTPTMMKKESVINPIQKQTPK